MTRIWLVAFSIFPFYTPVSTAGDLVKMVKVKGGIYRPFFDRSKEGEKKPISVASFFMDVTPVTNYQYLQFVKEETRWRKSKVKGIFSEKSYLNHWLGDLSFNAADTHRPVRFVSWFTALKYCEWKGKSLPSVLQWEYVASADEKVAYAMDSKEYKEKILKWYARPSIDDLPDVGKGVKNYWGVYDMHGLQWEWTLDFNTALVTGESRADASLDKNRFCGSGSLGAKDKLDYGAFMRFGFRSSLKGNYTVGNLGFRCVR